MFRVCTTNLIILDDGLLLRDIDTIQKLPNILLLHQTALMNVSGRPRHQLKVVAFQCQLILLLSRIRPGRRHTFSDGNTTDKLLAQEVTNFDILAIVRHADVDGKMGICETHSVSVALGNTNNHIADMSAEGLDTGNIAALAKPNFTFEDTGSIVPFDHAHVIEAVPQVPGQGSTGTCHCNNTSLDSDFHIVRDLDDFGRVQFSHLPEFGAPGWR
eukprot:CAMPEP_0174286326 /NCGR_PEP_ID=MMETSP0809-20121228/11434_1 /TAXON_ID=73025 ORGANISM="Eutreptiella gymnastica-like, Strain CCMP1594" /NCGR_SAMPLE_ID=MMETSP0809 /ASSEMBLY_ACC=CAM_ASM_000658 /LENGTH=214 /DNA_ID=CAMNT_0015382349 /DNA_START=34 /DNA_END=678 /DNA_ORIENTATION=-